MRRNFGRAAILNHVCERAVARTVAAQVADYAACSWNIDSACTVSRSKVVAASSVGAT
jgi:hypothetical protein